MAHCLPAPRTSPPTIEEAHVKLHFFVENFVTYFEQKLESYLEERTGQTQSSTKSALLAQNLCSAIGEIFSAGNAAGLVSNFLCKLIYDHRDKAKRATGVFLCGDELRKELVKAGIDIFRCLESQYLKISNVNNWKIELFVIAIDAVERIMNYIDSSNKELLKKGCDFIRNFFTSKIAVNSCESSTGQGRSVNQENPINSSPDLFHNFITTCFIKGDSKGIFGTVWPTRSVNTETQKWKTSKMYDKVGIRVQIDGIEKYFKRKKSKRAKYGYRLSFEWETRNEEQLKKHFDLIDLVIDPSLYGDVHKYLLPENVVKENWQKIYQEINRNDPDKMSDHFQMVTDLITEVVQKIQNVKNDSKKIISILNLLNVNQETMTDNQIGIRGLLLEIIKRIEELLSSKSKSEIEKIMSIKAPVKSFIGRLEQLKKLNSIFRKEPNCGIVISGMGGVGKSELSRKFAFDCSKDFHSIVWINSETKIDTDNSFKELAGKLNIPLTKTVQHFQPEIKKIEEIVEDVYKHFKDVKLLIIFDNVEELNDIKSLLPKPLPNYVEPKLLITSRHQRWKHGDEVKLKVVDLDEFTEDEAVEYLKNELSEQINESTFEKEVKLLARKLQYLPLALRQAATYIRTNDEDMMMRYGTHFCIEEYLVLFDEEEERSIALLNYQATDSERYSKTLYTTWKITMNVIQEKEHGKTAIEVIGSMAYLAPDRIQVEKIFDSGFEAAKLLHNYSMIDYEAGLASMHRLVQKVIRLWWKEDKNEETYLGIAFKGIYKNCFINNVHVPYIWTYGCRFDDLVKNFYLLPINSDKSSPLHVLAENGLHGPIKTLLAKLKFIWPQDFSKIINAPNNISLETPLFKCVKPFYVDIFKTFVEKGAKIDIRCLNQSLTQYVCRYGNWDMVEYLVSRGVDLKSPEQFNLHYACRGGKLDIVQKLIDVGLNPTSVDNQGNTPLHYACESGSATMVDALLKLGVDMNIGNKQGVTPLHYACDRGRLEILMYFSNTTANFKCTDTNGATLLHYACRNGHQNVVTYLLSMKFDVNSVDRNHTSLLHYACEAGYLEVVETLIRGGAEVNCQNKDEYAPLHYATEIFDVNIIKCLLDNNAHPNVQNKNGTTPLHVSCRMTKRLSGHSPSTIISKAEYVEYIKTEEKDAINLLVDFRADINCVDENGDTPLHVACESGNYKAMYTLCSYKAKIDVKNKNGKTPTDIARENSENSSALFAQREHVNDMCRCRLCALSMNKNRKTLADIARENAPNNTFSENSSAGLYEAYVEHFYKRCWCRECALSMFSEDYASIDRCSAPEIKQINFKQMFRFHGKKRCTILT